MPTQVHEQMPAAHSLEDAANSENSLQGYAAINDVHNPRLTEHKEEDTQHPQHHAHPWDVDERLEIERLAYQFYEARGTGEGSADDDWFRAEREVYGRRPQVVHPD